MEEEKKEPTKLRKTSSYKVEDFEVHNREKIIGEIRKQ
jgi:hypothetical protein